MDDQLITVVLPRSHWNQIVDDIENMCGTAAEEIEILASAEVVDHG